MKKPQLFLLHFAGGNCYSFQFMSALLEDFTFVPLELPGRGKRAKEALINDFGQAAEDLFKQLKQKLVSSGFLIYGHSMGAYLALRISNMLAKEGISPACLIVSGNPGPGITDDKKRYLMAGEEFTDELKRLGGVPEELMANKELMDFFEPILRADFEIAEKNEISGESPVNVPIYAMMGNEEEDIDKIPDWGRFTQCDFNFEILDGGHFFIREHPGRIAAIIRECYYKAASMQHLLCKEIHPAILRNEVAKKI